MASKDYFASPSQTDYQPYRANRDESQLQAVPQYTSQAPSRAPSYSSRAPRPDVSPFETAFDDHIYPARGQHQGSQNSFGNSSFAPTLPGTSSQYGDDIPLREQKRTPNPDPLENDHVYDAAAVDRADSGKKKRPGNGFFSKSQGRIPWVVYTLTFIQVVVFIVEIVKNGQLTGSPIEIHPSFNPMIGPSPYVLINMGARYVGCMHYVDGIDLSANPAINWPCPNTTTSIASDSSNMCSLGELCGFNGVPANGGEPNQWFRFILPIFLHAGIIHIGFNMLLQVTMGREMEISIGPIRFFLVYMSAGIFGFVFGGNFAATGIASTGASGSLFGVIALTLLDLLYTWKTRLSPWKDFAFIALDVVISFALGLLPGLDNFSHIGGFLMGLVLGICILHSPASLRERIGSDDPPYTPVAQVKASDGSYPNSGVTGFIKAPVGFFKNRKGAWWAWWFIRAGALAGVLIVFILLLNNFYIYRNTCSWCKYLSCINVNNWCDIYNLSTTTSKRDVFDSWESVAKRYIEFKA